MCEAVCRDARPAVASFTQSFSLRIQNLQDYLEHVGVGHWTWKNETTYRTIYRSNKIKAFVNLKTSEECWCQSPVLDSSRISEMFKGVYPMGRLSFTSRHGDERTRTL